jgi:hypothetical protein
MKNLSTWANLASIATFFIAGFGYAKYQCDRLKKQKLLENYLETVKKDDAKEGKEGKKSIRHLIAKVGMTEAEILQASFNSKKIIRVTKSKKKGPLAGKIMLVFRDK